MGSNEALKILKFYRGSAPDDKGRFLSEILSWNDSDLENIHDYIQWLFPTFERSAFQPDIPTLTTELVSEFSRDTDLRFRLGESFHRMLQFYGFTIDQPHGTLIVNAPNFPERSKVWLTPGNHNHLRITRILKSLTALGLREKAHAFLTHLEYVYEQSPSARAAVSPRTLQFWRSSVAYF